MVKPDDIEVRNPRYAGAKTPGDLVRALMRPRKPKGDEVPRGQGEQPPDSQTGRIMLQRKK